MEHWLEAWTRIHHHSYTVVAVCGLVATVVLAGPGDNFVTLGPVRLDAFYLSLVAFTALLVISLADEYNPAEYGIDRKDSGE
jgi:hypothetical protein